MLEIVEDDQFNAAGFDEPCQAHCQRGPCAFVIGRISQPAESLLGQVSDGHRRRNLHVKDRHAHTFVGQDPLEAVGVGSDQRGLSRARHTFEGHALGLTHELGYPLAL